MNKRNKKLCMVMTICVALSLAVSCGDKEEEKISITTTKEDVENFFLKLDPESLYYDAKGGAKSVNLTSKGKWEFTSVPDWLEISPTEGTGNQTLTITASPNNSINPRSRAIKVQWYGGKVLNTSSFTVEQMKDSLQVTEMSYFLSGYANEGEDVLKISTVCGWKASSNKSWCRLSQTKGTADATLNITVDENNTLDMREAILTISKDTTRTLQIETVKVVVQQTSRNLPSVSLLSIREKSTGSQTADFTMAYTMAVAGAGYTSQPVNEIGICYSPVNTVPAVDNATVKELDMPDPHVAEVSGTITGLESNTKYYVRAYAKCSYGIGYSDVKTFTTK